MSNFATQSWQPRAGSRLGSLVWWLAVLLVLHGALPIAPQLPGGNERPLFGALALVSGPTLRPFGLSAKSPTVQTEARPNAAPPHRFSEQDPPKTALPLSAPTERSGTAALPPSAHDEQLRHKAWRLFEARAPPTIA